VAECRRASLGEPAIEVAGEEGLRLLGESLVVFALITQLYALQPHGYEAGREGLRETE
jgi:hypothetical protein